MRELLTGMCLVGAAAAFALYVGLRHARRLARAAGKAVLIAPDEPLQISRVCHDPNVMQRVYDIGRKAGETADLTFA